MYIDTKPTTAPHPLRVIRHRVGRVMSPRRSREPNVIVRVNLSVYRSQLYAYRLGRGDYTGPLKTARLVR